MPIPRSIRYSDLEGFQCLEDIENDSVDLHLYTCGMEDCAPLHSFGPGTRPYFIFHFILEGHGFLESNGTITPLGPNDIFLVYPGQTIHYWADRSDPWHYMWIGFGGIKAASYVKYAGYTNSVLTGTFENCRLIQPYIRQIIACRTYTPANDLKRTAALMEILALLINGSDSYATSPAVSKLEYVDKARAMIERQYDCDIHIQHLADAIGIDRSYLCRIFKEVLFLSPQEYLKQFRLHKAALLLQDPHLKVAAIARMTGYQDYASFARLFKQYKGMTPTEYRRQFSGN